MVPAERVPSGAPPPGGRLSSWMTNAVREVCRAVEEGHVEGVVNEYKMHMMV